MGGREEGQLEELLKSVGAFSHNALQRCSHFSRAFSQSLSNLSASQHHPFLSANIFCSGNEHKISPNYFNLLKLPESVTQGRSLFLDGAHSFNSQNFAKITSWISKRQSDRLNLGRITPTDESNASQQNVDNVGGGNHAVVDGGEADIYFSGKVKFGKQTAVDVSDTSLSDLTSFVIQKPSVGERILRGSLNGEKHKHPVLVASETILQEKVGGPTSKEELGRASWTLLHTLAAQYPDKPTRQQQRDVKELMAILSRIYPCKQCADHFKEVLRLHPVKAGSRLELAQWMCRVHNIVNRSLGKIQFPCERVDARWGALDCDEAACDLQGRLSTR